MFWLLYEKFNALPLFAGVLAVPFALLLLVSMTFGIFCFIPKL